MESHQALMLTLVACCVGPGPAFSMPSTVEHDLALWLNGLAVRLPDHSQKQLGSTIDMLGLTCNNFKVDFVNVTELAHSDTSREVLISVRDARIEHCGGTWTLTEGISRQPSQQGKFSWSIIEMNLLLPVILDASQQSQPIYVRRNGCQTSLRVYGVSFEGDMSLPLTLLSNMLTKMLVPLMDNWGCTMPTSLLADLNRHLVGWLKPPGRPPEPVPAALPQWVPKEKLVDWRQDAPLLQHVPGPAAEAQALRILIGKLTHGTDRIGGGLPVQFALTANQSAQLGLRARANVTDFAVAGLGSVLECQLLAAVQEKAHSLQSSCSFSRLNVTVSIALELMPLDEEVAPMIIASSGLVLHTSMSMSLKGIHTAVQALVAADRTKAHELTVSGLLHLPPRVSLATLAALLYTVNVTLLDEVIDEIADVSFLLDGGQLGGELAGAFNALVSTFLSAPSFQFVLPNAFRGEVYPRARAALNEQLARIDELWPMASPDGGAMLEYPTEGIDPARSRWVVICSVFVFLPAYAIAYALARSSKRRRSVPAEAFLNGWAAGPATGSFRTFGPTSLADACLGPTKCGLPLLAFGVMACGLVGILTPGCDVRVKAFGGLLDASKPMVDESLIVYSFFNMLHDFWEAGAELVSISLVVGCLIVPQLGSIVALLSFAAPVNPKLRGCCCLVLAVIMHITMTEMSFLALLICIVRLRNVVSGGEIDVVAEPNLAIISALPLSFGVMLLAALLLYLHREHTTVNSPAERRAATVPRKVALPALVASIVGALCLCAAFAMKMLSVEIGGVVGLAESLPSARLPARRDFWALDLPRFVMASTDEKAIAFFMGILHFVVMGVAPVACFASWVLQWGWVAATKQHPHAGECRPVRWATLASPYLYCWCCLDALAITVFVGYLELDLPVQFLARNKFAGLCELVQSDLGQPCIHVGMELQPGFGFLLVAAVLSLALFLVSYKYLGLGRHSAQI